MRHAELMVDPWLKRKLNRQTRIQEHYDYIDEYCPEFWSMELGMVIDVGPGPGELLEIARAMGHDHLGIDASTGAGGMGDPYLECSRLMQERQELTIYRGGLTGFLDDWRKNANARSEMTGQACFINSRGSIEQSFSACMDGEPHDVHQDCKRLRWSLSSQLKLYFQEMFEAFAELLRPAGVLLIHANGAANTDVYDALVKEMSVACGLFDMQRISDRLHKWTRRKAKLNGS